MCVCVCVAGYPGLLVQRTLSMEARVFADGTRDVRALHDFEFDRIDAPEWRRLMQAKPASRKVEWNPPAAATHKAEAGAPWRVSGERAVAADNEAAKVCFVV